MQPMILAQATIPNEVLYSVIGLLTAAVVVLSGLWIRAHDVHRQWSTEQIHAHVKSIVVLEHEYLGIKEDLAEIKMLLAEHTKHDLRIYQALVQRLGLKVEGNS